MRTALRQFLFFCLTVFLTFICVFVKPLILEAPKAFAVAPSQNYYAESLAESTITGTVAYQDKVTLTFTPDDNSTYVLIASWKMATNNTGANIKSKLTRTTGTPTDFNEIVYFPRDVLNYISGGALAIDSFGSSPGSQTYKIQFAVSNTGRIAKIKDARIIAMKLTSADKYAEVDTRTTTNSLTYIDKTTLSFTPDTTGDYIILSSAIVDSNNTGASVGVQMDIDGTPNTTMLKEPFNVLNRYYWGTMKKVNLDNSAHNIKIQYSINNASRLGGIAYAKIVAIRADRFLNNYYAEEDTRTTAVNPLTYQTKTTLTATPLAQDHLIIGTTGVDMNSTSIRVYSQLLKDTTPYSESQVEPQDVLNRGLPYFVVSKETLTNTSTSWYTQFKSSGNGTAGIESSRILVLELREPSVNVGSYGTQIGSASIGSSNKLLGGAFTFNRDSGSANVSSITISETGTISDANISGLILYYKQEATCSTTKPSDATQYNSSPGTFSSGSSTVTGSMSVGTSQICLYVEVDVGSGAGVGDTIEIQITDPSTQVSVSDGTVSPASAVAINGTTTVTAGGTLSVDIVDGTNTPVSNPSVAMSSTSVSFSSQTSTGTLGSSTEKVYMTSDSSANWQVSIGATSGSTALWANTGPTLYYDFNDPTSNAQDGGDTDTYGGQLSVNPSTGTLTPGSGCSNTGLSLGSSSAFNENVVNSIVLVSASSANSNCNWSLTGVGLSQSIPKEQMSSSYNMSFTIAIVAI